MGMFGSKKSREERTEEGLARAEDIAAGKGIAGKFAQSFLNDDDQASLAQGLAAARGAQTGAGAAAAGMPMVAATVTALSDTGTLVNHDPVVDMTVTMSTGQVVAMQTVVNKLQIPRVGDAVNMMANPGAPGTYVYAGLAG